MSLSRRSSMSPPKPAESTRELKHRVITCLNKLSDRDTLAVAATELESIARNLSHDSFYPFISCIHTTDSSEKSPVRKECVRLLGFLSEIHGDALSPHLSKMISTVVRRLRDPDSAVRSACVDAVTAMSSQITKPPFSTFLKSFVDVVLIEQDYNSQIGSALCLAAAIEAAPDPEPAHLSKILPRLLKLANSDCFKAKPALLLLIGSIVGANGAWSRAVLDSLVACIVEFLSSEDWATRKAAAEVLGRVAVAQSDLTVEYKKTCLTSLERRRFDKVKVVRDTMNHSLELWKQVSDPSDNVLPPSEIKLSLKDSGNGGRSPIFKSSHDVACETAQTKKMTPSCRSPPSNNSLPGRAEKRSPLKSNDRKSYTAISRKLDCNPDWRTEVVVALPPSEKPCEDDLKKRECGVSESGENENVRISRLETKRALFSKICDEKMHMFGGLKAGSRVFPIHENYHSKLAAVGNHGPDEVYGDHKDIDDLDSIREQLVQIENQQSNLLNVLQRFIGSSQSGMNSLETRVNGLEMALDEISYNLAVSTGRVPNTDSEGNMCCKLPGAEFLSPKFWRRAEGRYPTSRLSSSGNIRPLNSMGNMLDKGANAETYKIDNQWFQHQNGGGFDNDSKAAICCDTEFSNRTFKSINQGSQRVYARNYGELNGSSPGACVTPANRSNRLAT